MLLLLLFNSGCGKQSSPLPATNQATANKPVQQTEADRKAFEETKAKADNGAPAAQLKLGFRYMSGDGVNQDAVEAVKWYRKAAEQGDADAQQTLGECYYFGGVVTKDLVEAVNWFHKAAEQNNPKAQNDLGVCYGNGYGVAKDDAEAVEWYRKAAEQGAAEAQRNLGWCYSNGFGVTKNYMESHKWLSLASSQGNEQAKQQLSEIEALMTPDQLATAQKTEAEQKFLEDVQVLAKKGEPVAQNALGLFYVHGQGVAQDYVEAANWFRKAAEQGYADAQFNLGVCYENGDGVTKDLAEAIKWYHKAAVQGDVGAQFNLGYHFPTSACKGSRPSWPGARSLRCPACRMMRAIFRSACRCSRAIRAARWWTSTATWWAWCRPSSTPAQPLPPAARCRRMSIMR